MLEEVSRPGCLLYEHVDVPSSQVAVHTERCDPQLHDRRLLSCLPQCRQPYPETKSIPGMQEAQGKVCDLFASL